MFYSIDELQKIGFKKIGTNVLISDKCSIYGANKISIGDNVRIDDFCILSAGSEITIGDYVHISCYASLIGKGKIVLDDFSGLSLRCTVLSSSDNFSGEFLTNPMIPEKYLNVKHMDVIFKKHALVGAGSVVLPGVVVGEGAAVGAMSLVKKSINPYEIWAGNPLKFIKDRSDVLLDLEKELRDENI